MGCWRVAALYGGGGGGRAWGKGGVRLGGQGEVGSGRNQGFDDRAGAVHHEVRAESERISQTGLVGRGGSSGGGREGGCPNRVLAKMVTACSVQSSTQPGPRRRTDLIEWRSDLIIGSAVTYEARPIT